MGHSKVGFEATVGKPREPDQRGYAARFVGVRFIMKREKDWKKKRG